MKKLLFLLFLIISIPSFSQNDSINDNLEQIVKNDIDTIKSSIDTSIVIVKEIGGILKEEFKAYGLKKTIQINTPIFLPITIFIILYLVWLKNRKTKK